MKTYSVLALRFATGAFLFASLAWANAEPWVARHGMTATQFQTEFNTWTAAPYRLRPAVIAGYAESGEARYAAIFEKRSGAWTAAHGLSETAFLQQVENFRSRGYRPTYFSAFGVESSAVFNGIWEPTNNTNFQFYARLTPGEFGSRSNTLTSAGYRLVEICPFTLGAAEYSASLWEKPVEVILTPTVFRHRETAAQYQTTFNQLTAAGWRLVNLHGFAVNGQTRFTSHWTKAVIPGPDWWTYHGLTVTNFRGGMWNATYQGYRPAYVSVYSDEGATRINAIWTRNGGFGGNVISQIDDLVGTYMQTNAVPGLTLAISRGGNLIFAKGYGYADAEAGERVHPLHRFRIASVSKPFCAAAVLKLVDRGQIALSNTVFGAGALLGTNYGDGIYSPREKQITVRNLLNHTTGWDDSTEQPIWDNANGNNTGAVIRQVLDHYEPVMDPGMQYDYSNIGYCVAARVIEKQSGKTYEQFVRDEILTPCGVTDMEIGNQTRVGRKPREPVYYSASNADPYATVNPRRMDANGGWIAKPMDLLLFARRIVRNTPQKKLLSASSLSEMQMGSAANATYGFGWFWNNQDHYAGHNGAMPGSLAWLLTFSSDDIAFAVMTNLRPSGDVYAADLNRMLLRIHTLLTNVPPPSIDLFPSSSPPDDLSARWQFGVSVLNPDSKN